MAVRYTPAPSVAATAAELISAHHQRLLDYGHIRIEYVFRSEHANSNGKAVWGRARKITGLNAYLASNEPDDEEEIEPFFVIEIAADIWEALDGAGRRALVDHELSHCNVVEGDDGTVKLGLVAHDLEEFEAIVRRHGLWRSDVASFAKVAADHIEDRQLRLVDGDGE
jgi:hypothetical protein